MKKKPQTKPKNTKLKSFFRKANEVSKQQSEEEKRKKAIKEQKKKQQIKPQGYTAKKVGVVVFWCLFGFILCFSFGNLIANNSNKEDEKENDVINQSVATVEGVNFAENFLYTYLNYSQKEDIQSKLTSLQYYLESNVSTETLSSTYGNWELQTNRNDIMLVESKYVDEFERLYTFQTTITYKGTESVKDVSKDVDDVLQTEEEKAQQKEELALQQEAIKKGFATSTKFIQVPVYYDEKLNRYTIIDYPSFVGVDKNSRVEVKNGNFTEKFKRANATVSGEIEEFLPTFFKSYTSDSDEQLSYILKDEKAHSLLGSGLTVSKIEPPKVYDSNKKDEYIVQVAVEMQDISTLTTHTTNYYLIIEEKDNAFFVSKLNDLEYIKSIGNPSLVKSDTKTKATETEIETEK